MEWRPAAWSVCLSLLISPCTISSRSSLLAPAHPGGPGKRAIKRLWYDLSTISNYPLTEQTITNNQTDEIISNKKIYQHKPSTTLKDMILICEIQTTHYFWILFNQPSCLEVIQVRTYQVSSKASWPGSVLKPKPRFLGESEPKPKLRF